MGFWIYMLCMVLLIPVTMLVLGYLLQHKPPKERNPYFGYRSRRSRSGPEAWAYAQRWAGRFCWFLGWSLLLPSLLAMLPLRGEESAAVGSFGALLCLLQCIPLLFSSLYVEKGMKEEFGL